MLLNLLKVLVTALGLLLSLIVGLSLIESQDLGTALILTIAAGTYIGAGIDAYIDRISQLEEQ